MPPQRYRLPVTPAPPPSPPSLAVPHLSPPAHVPAAPGREPSCLFVPEAAWPALVTSLDLGDSRSLALRCAPVTPARRGGAEEAPRIRAGALGDRAPHGAQLVSLGPLPPPRDREERRVLGGHLAALLLPQPQRLGRSQFGG